MSNINIKAIGSIKSLTTIRASSLSVDLYTVTCHSSAVPKYFTKQFGSGHEITLIMYLLTVIKIVIQKELANRMFNCVLKLGGSIKNQNMIKCLFYLVTEKDIYKS